MPNKIEADYARAGIKHLERIYKEFENRRVRRSVFFTRLGFVYKIKKTEAKNLLHIWRRQGRVMMVSRSKFLEFRGGSHD